MRGQTAKAVMDWFAILALCALLIVGIAKACDWYFSGRCKNISGEWHTWRGCKVVNVKGETQWVTRP